jgi:hypothetical protein
LGNWCRREILDYGLYDIRYDYCFEELAGIAAAESLEEVDSCDLEEVRIVR